MAVNPARQSQNAASRLVLKGFGEKAAGLANLLKYEPSDPIAQRIIAGGLAGGIFMLCAAGSVVLLRNGGIKIILEAAKEQSGS